MTWLRSATNASCSSARARACACTSPVATHATPSRRGERAQARGCGRGRGGRRGAAAPRAGPPARRPRAAAGPSPGVRALARSMRRRALGAARQADETLGMLEHGLQRHRGLGALAPAEPSRVCACASVMIRQRFLQPRPSRTSSVRWRARRAHRRRQSGQTSISAPWIARTPPAVAAWASSIEPETELWSVSASASWPSSPARRASSSGSEAPSRNE